MERPERQRPPRPARYRSRSPPASSSASAAPNNRRATLVNVAAVLQQQQHSSTPPTLPPSLSSLSSSGVAAAVPVPAAAGGQRATSGGVSNRRPVPGGILPRAAANPPRVSHIHATSTSTATASTYTGTATTATRYRARSLAPRPLDENSRSRSRERPLVPVYAHAHAHWHSLHPASPAPVPTVATDLEPASEPNISRQSNSAHTQTKTQTQTLHSRSFSSNLLQPPTTHKGDSSSHSRSHSHGALHILSNTTAKAGSPSLAPATPGPSDQSLHPPPSPIRGLRARTKSLQNLLSTENYFHTSKPPSEEVHDKGMRRISKFFRSTSATHQDDNGKLVIPAKPSHKMLSKSTSHLPLSHAHPPSNIPDIPEQPRRAATLTRDDSEVGMLSPTAAKLGSRPVTRDGITIPPPLPMLLPHDVVVSGSETGSGGNADPCNISNQPTPVTFDGQKDTKLGTPSRTGTPETPYGSRPSTPQGGATDQKLHRKRLSMLPGGRKKPSSRDGELSPDFVKAWKLELGYEGLHGESYDLAPLDRGNEVPDMWDPRGDTLVFLSAPPVPGQPEPRASFRITSSPLMFAAMAGYIQDVSPLGLPAIDSIEEEEPVGQNELFLNLPRSSAEGGGDWGTLDDIIGREAEGGGTRMTASPEPELGAVSPTSGSGSESKRHTSSSSHSYDTYQVRYKLYYSRVAQQERNDHGDRKSSGLARLLDARNLFAFLDKKSLVASLERINAFRVLEKLYLQLFIEPATTSGSSGSSTPINTGSPPGSPRLGGRMHRKGHSTPPPPPRSPNAPSYGGVHHHTMIDDLPTKIRLAESHLDHYIDELRLDDVRELPADDSDAPKIRGGFRDSMEAMYLGEKWRSSRLFLEGYLHTVGRWEEFKSARHPLVEFLSPMTLAKLDRAALDLENRVREVFERFAGPAGEFAYPAMFSGVGKYPRFKRWREGFSDTQQLFLKHLKWVYGSWPPRAGKRGKGGGGGGERGGLNREVLKRVERDMGMLWDLLVDWERPRYPPGGFGEDDAAAEMVDGEAENELRSLLEEFDRSSPPVQPRPMFDMPQLPKPPGTPAKKPAAGKKEKSKKVKGDQVTQILQDSWTSIPALAPAVADTATELVQRFKEMELDFAQNKVLGSTQGRPIEDIQEYRKGTWIFIYAVLQSLPMLVVDAPICRWSEGCEYFLCVGWKHPVLPWEDRDAVAGASRPRGGGGGGGGGGSGNRRSSVMWASAPGGAAPSPTLGGWPTTLASDTAHLSELILPEGIDDDEVGAAYHRSYCWVRAAGWCVRWEDEQRGKREEEMRGVLGRERERWEEEMRGRREEFAAAGGSECGSGSGGEGRMTPLRKSSPPAAGGYYQQQQHHQQQGGYIPEKRTSSLGSRSVGSVGSAGSAASRSSGSGVVGVNNPKRTSSMGMGMGMGMGLAGVSVDDIPEVLLPSTREKRMSSYGSMGVVGGRRGM